MILSPCESKKRLMAVLSGEEVKTDIGTGYDPTKVNVIEMNENQIVENHHV